MSDSQWHVGRNGAPQGPFTFLQLTQMAATGGLAPADLVWQPGMPQWTPAGNVPGIFVAPVMAVPAPAAANIGYYAPPPTGYRAPGIGDDPAMRMLLPVGRSGWAIAAGYLGLFSFIIFPAPLSLIISIIALVDLRRHPEKHGKGRAIFGLIMGILGSLCFIPIIVSIIMK